MRISSNTLFDSNVTLLGQQQTRLLQTQQQIASGRRILAASDDPVAAARALEIGQSDTMNTQYAVNRTAARHKLSLAESNLQSVTSLLQDVRTAVVGAGNGTFNNNDRQTIAADLSGRLQELTGLANSTDGAGNYLFAGFQSKTQPFVNTAAGVGYFGDDGQQNMQVSATRQIASGDSGSDVFMRVKNGNGTFVAQAAATNAGTGVISQGSVTNPAALVAGNSYSISFGLVAGVMNYTVTGAPVALAAPVTGVYVSGQTIGFDGMQLDIQGMPAVTDTFTVTPSANESVFKTISDLISALDTPTVGANLTNSLNNGLNQLDNALNNILTVRSSLGLRLNEIDALQSAGEDLGLQFKQNLSELQDVDYNKAISDLTQQQMSLQAAQQTFAKVAGLSLFDYL
ncbi:MAG: flagellar hook-associated protein FlgL [Gallionella sp.]|nr:flagellar hook-associated protein FlgL [Gallionella sp.]